MRSIRLLKTFLRSAFQQETAYRLNFFLQLLGTALGLAGSLGGILILFANNEHLNGWSMSQTLAVLGVYLLVQALNSLAVSPSLNQLGGMGGELETGNFDYTLLKPISKQFYVSLRTWSFWPLLDAAAAVVVLVLAVSGQQAAVTPGNALLFLLTLLIALGLVYALMLLLTSVAFWYRGTYVLWILNDVMQAGRYPIGLYPRSVRLLLTWVLPIGFIVTVPAETLLGVAPGWALPAGFLLLAALFTLSTLFFRRSVRRYVGASS